MSSLHFTALFYCVVMSICVVVALKLCFLNLHRKVSVFDNKNKSQSMLLVQMKCPCLTFALLFCCCREEENSDEFFRCQPYKNIAVSVEKFNPLILPTSK